MSEVYHLKDLPLFYNLNCHRFRQVEHTKRLAHVRFRAVWKLNDTYCEWFGDSPVVEIERKVPVRPDTAMLTIIRAVWSDKDFIALIMQAAANAVESLADYSDKYHRSDKKWVCIDVKRVCLHEEIPIDSLAIGVPRKKRIKYGYPKVDYGEIPYHGPVLKHQTQYGLPRSSAT